MRSEPPDLSRKAKPGQVPYDNMTARKDEHIHSFTYLVNTSAMNVTEFLKQFQLPLSAEGKNKDGSCKPMSNSELRRHIEQRSILLNGEPVTPNEQIDFPIGSLVFFPNSAARKTTLW